MPLDAYPRGSHTTFVCADVGARIGCPYTRRVSTYISGGVREGPQTNRKQAFFIHPSILDACLTYEAWFGATLVRMLAIFFRSLHFLHSRRYAAYRHVNVLNVHQLSSLYQFSGVRIKLFRQYNDNEAVKNCLLFNFFKRLMNIIYKCNWI